MFFKPSWFQSKYDRREVCVSTTENRGSLGITANSEILCFLARRMTYDSIPYDKQAAFTVCAASVLFATRMVKVDRVW